MTLAASGSGNPFPSLRTARLLLTLPPIAMAAQLAEYFRRNLEHFAPSMPRLPMSEFDEAGCARRLAVAHAEFSAGSSVRFVLCNALNSEQPIGEVSLTNIVRGPFLAAYLGYRLDRRCLGQGYMTEAVRAVTSYAFDELGLHRIMANYVPGNDASARLLERVGFVVEGQARDYLYLDGAWRDHVLTALNNPRPIRPG